MTLLAAWLAADNHGPTSMYVASDSRISWPGQIGYDYARKVFALKNSPDIFGYCGDVLFPTMVLSQIVEMADDGLLFESKAPCEIKIKAIAQKLRYQFSQYPKEVSGIAKNSITIFHGSRDLENKKSFKANILTWSKKSSWRSTPLDLPGFSHVLYLGGDGRRDFDLKYPKYQQGPNKDTSRNIFHCFFDSLKNTTQSSVGGAPQIAGITRKPSSPAFYQGLILNRRRYYLGTRIDELKNFDRIKWTNKDFEVCDGLTGRRFPKAQKQKNPFL